jgi:hypothetical protein
MSDDTQVDATSTPDEATPYEPLGETTEGTAHVETVTTEEPEVGDSEHYVESPKVETDEQSFWDTQVIRPPFILSFVESDHPQGGFVVGWDTCGACMLHIRTCKCKNGPEQPKYVKNWRPKADTNHDKAQAVTPAIKKALVAADPQVVEKAVDEALGKTDLNPSGRKRRADAGKPRGPRKDPNATPDSVAEAAGNLSAAMSKE